MKALAGGAGPERLERTEPMKVLVTGGAGFIGMNIAIAMAARGHHVLTFDRVDSRANAIAHIKGDLGSWPHVLDVVARHRPEVIFHAGALLSAFAEDDFLGAIRGNAEGTFHVLESARQLGVRQVIFTSTIATYGRGAPEVVDDDTPQFPSSIYGVTKVYSERLGEYYHSRFGLDFRALRLPSVIGPGRGASGLSAYSSLMIENPMRGEPYTVPLEPSTRIPIIFAKDTVRAMLELAAADCANLTRRCYLLAGISPSAAEIANEVCSQVPSAQIDFAPDPQSQAIVDSWPKGVDETPARNDWGWKDGYDLRQIVTAFREAIR